LWQGITLYPFAQAPLLQPCACPPWSD
jgi:hypothetical protein